MKRVLTALVTVYSLTLLSELGSIWWIFDLVSHWRIFYIATGILFVCAALLLRQRRLASIVTICIGIHALAVAPYLTGYLHQSSQSHTATTAPIRVAFINTYWKQENLSELVNAIETIDADVLVLEELQPDQYQEITARLGEYRAGYHESVPYAFDMAVLSKLPINSVMPYYFVEQVPTLVISLLHEGVPFTVIGVHPNSPVASIYTQRRNTVLKQVFAYAETLETPIVMGGDFNITQFSPEFREITAGSTLIDTQLLFPLQTTWPAEIPDIFAIPIDHAFVSSDVHVLDRFIGPNTGSDHLPLVLDVAL